MKKILCLVLVALLLFSLTLVASASVINGSGSGNGVNQVQQGESFVNLLDNAFFNVTYYDSNGQIFRNDPVTSRPWSSILGFSSIEFYWTIDKPLPIESLYIVNTQRSTQNFNVYINGTKVSSFVNSAGIKDNLSSSYYILPSTNIRLINSIRIVFSGLDISSTAPVGIVQLLGNLRDTYAVPSGTFEFSYCGIFLEDGEQYAGFESLGDPISSTSFQLSRTLANTSLAYDRFQYGMVDIVIPVHSLFSRHLKYIELECYTYNEYISCSAYLSATSSPNSSGVQSVTGVPVSVNSFESNITFPSDINATYCYGYQYRFDLSGLDLTNQFLHVRICIDKFAYGESGHTAASYFVCNGASYVVDYDFSDSTLDRISTFLYDILTNSSFAVTSLNQLYDLVYSFLTNYDQPDYSTALETLVSNSSVTNQLLDEILLAIVNQPDSSVAIQEILTVLLSVDQTIGGIKSWLDNFDGFGSDFNTSLNHVYNSYETLEDQLAVLETVPKTDRNEYGDILLQIGSNVNTYLGESPLYDTSYDPSSPEAITTPLTFTTPLTAFYSGNIGSMIGTLLVVVISIALIGYVLFGKRGG